ncbi:hypothetical protein Y032_0498g2533 [Ancylostoma ceylanicum]|uniref:Uncharacterized protein n=1 Tax=Ancylostoma ceylanicum TaxID=53326 RepID=A0A016WUD5_9BILA|nr:hypothetical protein Y032_0498g2533 [Ancylostoma ceylanicum]
MSDLERNDNEPKLKYENLDDDCEVGLQKMRIDPRRSPTDEDRCLSPAVLLHLIYIVQKVVSHVACVTLESDSLPETPNMPRAVRCVLKS